MVDGLIVSERTYFANVFDNIRRACEVGEIDITDAEFEKCSKWFNDFVTISYERSEFLYRQGFFRGLVWGAGLETQLPDILNDVNSSFEKFYEPTLEKVTRTNILEHYSEEMRKSRVFSDMCFANFIPYLENWKKYNALWGEKLNDGGGV